MIGVATHNASKRGKWLPYAWVRVLIAILATEMITQGLLLGLRIVAPTPQYIIPISGIVGNAMVVSGLLLNRLQSETSAHRQEI
ncbi:ABC transporter permease [Ferviditalea candida]|uniref:ABC transporter permease n=1 Tax=Ferviditalea candida TaxID=3108399 RepID=A0ABU5ZGQ6_9BACL|nr:ABC transporter permease [Paenibacillaceae bacterium T2]